MRILMNQSADGDTLYLESPETKTTHALQVCTKHRNLNTTDILQA